MSALQGFEITVVGGDTAIAMGAIDEVPVAAGTIDALGDADGTYLVVWNGVAFDHVLATAQAVVQTVLGTAVVATDAVTGVTYADRGRDVPASG